MSYLNTRHITPLSRKQRIALEALMRERRLSEVATARMLGISRSTLRRVIEGSPIHPKTFKSISAFL
jgi:DNA-binding NtrC family response regulator